MRIVGLKEFLALPNGTFFSFYLSADKAPDLCMKVETETVGLEFVNDFYYTPFTGTGTIKNPMEEILNAEKDPTVSLSMTHEEVRRWGMYNESAKFLVFTDEEIMGKLLAISAQLERIYVVKMHFGNRGFGTSSPWYEEVRADSYEQARALAWELPSYQNPDAYILEIKPKYPK